MGGEPLINPDYINWLSNVAYLWPKAKIIVYTNGTQFHQQPKLYDTIVELSKHRPGVLEIIVFTPEAPKGPSEANKPGVNNTLYL